MSDAELTVEEDPAPRDVETLSEGLGEHALPFTSTVSASRMRPPSGPVLAACCGVAALACATSYFARYQRAHPEWDPGSFPAPEATLAEVTAAIERPEPREIPFMSTSKKLKIYRTDVEPWPEVEPPDPRAANPPPTVAGDFLLLVRWRCISSYVVGAGAGASVERTAWYLLPRGRLAAYEHYRFDLPGCDPRHEFDPGSGKGALQRKAVLDRAAAIEPFSQGAFHLRSATAKGRSVAFTDFAQLATEEYTRALAYARRGESDAGSAALGRADAMAVLVRAQGIELDQAGVGFPVPDTKALGALRQRVLDALAKPPPGPEVRGPGAGAVAGAAGAPGLRAHRR